MTALLAAAVLAEPDGLVPVGGPDDVLTLAELDRRSAAVATALLAAGLRPGAAVRVEPCRGVDRAVGLLGAWWAGFVVDLGADARLPVTVEPADRPGPAAANLLHSAERDIWSRTPALVTAAGRGLDHGEVVGLLGDAADPTRTLGRLVQLAPP